MVITGTGNGLAGYGMGKSNEVPDAIRKATEQAKKSMVKINKKDTTIPHSVEGKFGAAKVILKPAPKGHGLVAGKVMRAILEAAGVKDITAKSLGSNNSINLVRATFKALSTLKIRTNETE